MQGYAARKGNRWYVPPATGVKTAGGDWANYAATTARTPR